MRNKRFIHRGLTYSSKKHPILEHIFRCKNPALDATQEVISFTLRDISAAYQACGIAETASISNTILDLTRKRSSIEARLPTSSFALGYDLRKKTGRAPDGSNYAGEFVLVGAGQQIQSWLEWADDLPTLTVSSQPIHLKSDLFCGATKAHFFL